MTAPVSEKEFLDRLQRGIYYDNAQQYVRDVFMDPQRPGHAVEPDVWQQEVLDAYSHETQISCASGHGVGKSALAGWTIHWFTATRDHPQIVVTANTGAQLSGKTWRELKKWNDRAVNGKHFKWTATRFYHRGDPDTWFAQAVPWSEQNSEAFAGTHETTGVLMLFDEACFSDDTEVLTDKGWIRFDALNGSEMLMARRHDGTCALEKPIALHRFHHQGEMREIRRRGASLCVTPNHRMIYADQRGIEYLEEIDKIPIQFWTVPRHLDVVDSANDVFTIPAFKSARKEWAPLTVPMYEWMYFLGWYASEGSTNKRKQASGCVAHNVVCITNGDLSALEDIQDLVAGWGIKSTITVLPTTPQLLIHSRQIAEYLACHGWYCTNKRLPPEFRLASKRDLQYFIYSYIEGDGYWNRRRGIAYTSSRLLADDVQELFMRAGYYSVISQRTTEGCVIDGRAIKASDGYVVSLSPNAGNLYVKPGDVHIVPYDGMVYCATTPSGTLMTRRDGYPIWSGNSAISDSIFEVAAGALTTEGALWVLFGNPTRNTGYFRETFDGGQHAHRWWNKQVDSRDAKMTDKKRLKEWEDDYGVDSDFFRVRVRGVFPRQSTSQFIPSDIVDNAMARIIQQREYLRDQKIIGVDVAKGGGSGDRHAICRRQGRKAWNPKPYAEIDTMQLVSEIIDEYFSWKADLVCVDGTGVGTGVVHRLRELNIPVVDVMVGSQSTDPVQYFNLRTELWGRARQWLRGDVDLDPDELLRKELIAPEYDHTGKMQLRLEPKKYTKQRLGYSPDLAESFIMTHAADALGDSRHIALPIVKAPMRGWW